MNSILKGLDIPVGLCSHGAAFTAIPQYGSNEELSSFVFVRRLIPFFFQILLNFATADIVIASLVLISVVERRSFVRLEPKYLNKDIYAHFLFLWKVPQICFWEDEILDLFSLFRSQWSQNFIFHQDIEPHRKDFWISEEDS